MSVTITLSGDWLQSIGSRLQTVGSGNLGVYATNGVAVTPKACGLGVIESLLIFPAGGLVFEYVPSTAKIKAYRSAAVTPAGSISTPSVTLTPGTQIAKFSWQNVAAADADTAGSDTADQAAGPSNDDAIDTYAAVAGGAWAYTENAEIDIPRNVCIALQEPGGAGIAMEEGDTVFTVTGTFRGAAQTDTITFTLNAGNKTIASAKFRWLFGVKPFDHITNVTATGFTATQNGLLVGVGYGRKLGLPVDPDSGTAGDIVKVTKNSVDVAVGTYNNTNKTLDQGAISANDDFDIEVKVDVAAASAALSGAPVLTGTPIAQAALDEVTNATNLAGTTFRWIAVGY